jgi:ribonuclease Z
MTDNISLTFLGTGNAMVTKCYNTCFTISCDNHHFLVDAGGGNGILAQLEKTGISFNQIDGMFITHGHTDHILGALWIIRKMAMLTSAGKRTVPFDIYCHDEVADMLMTFCKLTLKKKLMDEIGSHIIITTVTDGTSLKASNYDFTFFDIHSTKKKQFGFKAILPDGQSLVCLGDEPYNSSNRQYVENADWLLSEAFCLYADRDTFKPYEKNHSTALDAGKIAEELHIKNLVLYHTEDSDLANRKSRYTAEGKSVFSGKVYVPDDLETIRLTVRP